MSDFDVIVVGAGPAGSSAAMLLAANSIRTLIIDKSSFPRDKGCGGGLTIRAQKSIEKITGFPYNDGAFQNLMRIGKVENNKIVPSVSMISAKPLFEVVEREKFDKHLLDGAIEAGAIFDNSTVLKVEPVEERFKVITDSGEFHSKYVVIASGVFGARLFEGLKGPDYTVVYHGRLAGPATGATIAFMNDGYAWMFPGNDFTSVGIGAYPDFNMITYEAAKSIINSIAGKELEVKGTPLSIFEPSTALELIKAFNGCLFVGDSAGFVDNWTGEGIDFALETGYKAGMAILKKFEKPDELNENYLGSIQYLAKHLELAEGLRKAFFKNLDRNLELLKDKRFSRMLYEYLSTYSSGIKRLFFKSLFKRGFNIKTED